MKTTFAILLIGFLFCGCSQEPASSAPKTNQTKNDQVAQLTKRVDQLEKQVQEISQLMGPLKDQLAVDRRRKALRAKFDDKMARDRKKYSREQLQEAEQLYQIANQKWGSPQASESLRTMIEKYPDINRTGCAVLYIAQMTQGDERAKYLQDCIEKYNDCYYGDGVQVGAYARYVLVQDYRSRGKEAEAKALAAEIKNSYADAIDHSGHLLVDGLGDGAN